VPNYYGEQRFGLRGDTHLLGQALVRGDDKTFVRHMVGLPHPAESTQVQEARSLVEAGNLAASLQVWPRHMGNERRIVQTLLDHPEDWRRATQSVPTKMRKFFVSAYQAALFNRILTRRLDALDRLQPGDLASIHGKRAVFLVEDVEIEQPRADRLEISPSGPLYGYKLTMAQGGPGEMERQVLAQEALELEDFRKRGLKMRGARRPLRIPLQDGRAWYDQGLMLSFSLPPGCYATTVLAEVTKTEPLEG
jgi:tRNA pseudouridine13 synthase